MCIKAIGTYPSAIQIIILNAIKLIKYVLKLFILVLLYPVPHQFKTQEICDKVIR